MRRMLTLLTAAIAALAASAAFAQSDHERLAGQIGIKPEQPAPAISLRSLV